MPGLLQLSHVYSSKNRTLGGKMVMRHISLLVLSLLLIGCVTTPIERNIDTETNLKLVVTDLVSVIVQVQKLNPLTTTLKYTEPDTRFGVLLLSALEDAGYGIQLVSTGGGSNFVAYALRSSETEAGQVNDYLISIDDLEVRREYNATQSGIYPSSLMFVNGSQTNDEILLDGSIFAEQGGNQAFLSGVETDSTDSTEPGTVREVIADSNSRIIANRRTDQKAALLSARRRSLESQRKNESSNLRGLNRYKKVIVLFSDNKSLQLGTGNKLAIRGLVDDYETGDVYEITACDDFDGENRMAEERAIRIKEEFMSYRIPSAALFRAPCVRANFRHQSDDSPTPVAIVQYRK